MLNKIKQKSPSAHFACLTEFKPVGWRLMFLSTVYLEPVTSSGTVTEASPAEALREYLLTGMKIKLSS